MQKNHYSSSRRISNSATIKICLCEAEFLFFNFQIQLMWRQVVHSSDRVEKCARNMDDTAPQEIISAFYKTFMISFENYLIDIDDAN